MKRTLMIGIAGWAAFVGPIGVEASSEIIMHYEPARPLTAPDAAVGKAKILRLSYETPAGFLAPLICVFNDAAGPEIWEIDGTTRAARDIFAMRSTDGGQTWSSPVNLSRTAKHSSMSVDHDGDPDTPLRPYYGDSSKPVVFSSGHNVLLTWVDRYCPTAEQRSVAYDDAGVCVELPYAAVYVARSVDGGETWGPRELLTDGFRDAIQPLPRGNVKGWVVTWQEDPRGLQPGEAEGPGDGGSGAKVTHGTDIWLSALAAADFSAGLPFPEGRRLTDNFTDVGEDGYESGVAGASRPALALVGPTAIVAYEETKGLGGADFGKYVRYHVLSAFDDSNPDATLAAGWIVSVPDENARRARLVAQGQPGSASGVKLCMFFKQGRYDQGGPSDIILRVGLNGFLPEHLYPPVDPACTTREAAFRSTPGMNLSSSAGLDALTDNDPFEDARAHRAVLRGDFIMFGYSWTPKWAVARFTDLANYNFFLRRSDDGGMTWDEARNMSRLADSTRSVYEPRLIATPSSSDPDDPRNTHVLFAAWGTELNQYDYLSERTIPLDLFITRSVDRGGKFEPVQMLAGGATMQSASQLRSNAAGDRISAVWLDEAESGGVAVQFRAGSAAPRVPGDANIDGVVDVIDLLIVLANWGSQDGGLPDVDGDGTVDFADVLMVLGNWGAA